MSTTKSPIYNSVSGITFIRYTQSQKSGKPNNSKVIESPKTKGHTG